MGSRKVLPGQRYGKWLVGDKTKRRSYDQCLLHECICECGTVLFQPGSRLLTGRSTMCSSCNAAKPKSAGMKMLNDITGKEICGLTVLERVARAGVTNAVYRCRCKCGKELTTSGSLLLRRKSVGCRSCFSKGSGANGWSGCGQFPGKFFTRIQNNARKRNIEYSLTKEYICDLYKQQNGKCSLSGVELRVCSSLSKGVFTASLDRIDSSRGYVKGNVQFVHARINVMKMELPQDEFIEWAKLVAKHNGGV